MQIELILSSEFFILALVIVIEWLLPFPQKYALTHLFYQLAQAFAKKVANTKNTESSETQEIISGSLALVFYLLIIAVLTISIVFVSTYDLWTQGLMLYFSLGYQTTARVSDEVITACHNKQFSLAKDLLKQITVYDTERLTALGIHKLTMESCLFHFVRLWLMPILLFLFFGGFASLTYAALAQAYYSWLPAKHKYHYFGKPVSACIYLVEWLPTLIFAPIYSLFKLAPNTSTHWITLFKLQQGTKSPITPESLWMSIVASGCDTELSGPLMLNSVKIKRPHILKGHRQNKKAIAELLSWNNYFRLFILVFSIATLIGLIFL